MKRLHPMYDNKTYRAIEFVSEMLKRGELTPEDLRNVKNGKKDGFPNIKTRTLRSGRIVKEEKKEVTVISSKCPEKWVCIDLENGNKWMLENGHFRGINAVEKKEVLSILKARK